MKFFGVLNFFIFLLLVIFVFYYFKFDLDNYIDKNEVLKTYKLINTSNNKYYSNIKDNIWKKINDWFKEKKKNLKTEKIKNEYALLLLWNEDDTFDIIESVEGQENKVNPKILIKKFVELLNNSKFKKKINGFFLVHNHPSIDKKETFQKGIYNHTIIYDSKLGASKSDFKVYEDLEKYFNKKNKKIYFDSLIYKNDDEKIGLYSTRFNQIFFELKKEKVTKNNEEKNISKTEINNNFEENSEEKILENFLNKIKNIDLNKKIGPLNIFNHLYKK